MTLPKSPFVIGHRGAAGLAPENTLAAIRAAFQHDTHAVEVDVQRTADGVPVVMHDTTVDRTTNGHGPLNALTWKRARGLDAGSWFAPSFAGEPVPSLDEVLQLIISAGKALVLEAKDPHRYPDIEQQIAQAIRRHAATDRVTVISFDHDWLRRFRNEEPHVALGYLWRVPSRDAVYAAGTTLVDVYWASLLVRPGLIRRWHKQGFLVAVWTLNAPWLMRVLLWLGVDAITSDRPDRWSFG